MQGLRGSWWLVGVTVAAVNASLACGGESAGDDSAGNSGGPSQGGSGPVSGSTAGAAGRSGRVGGGSGGAGGEGGDELITGGVGGSSGETAVAREFSSLGYEVHAVIAGEQASYDQTYDFTALFTKESDSWTLLASARGSFQRATLVPSPTGYTVEGEVTSDEFPLDTFVMRLPTANCDDLWLKELDIVTGDEDGDGVVDHFTARGRGDTLNSGCAGQDWLYSEPSVIELTGELDTNAPEVTAPAHYLNPAHRLNPLLPSFFVANEPLSADSILTLEGPSTFELVPDQRDGEDGPFWRFRVPPLTRFGATFEATVDGTDLSGHPIPMPDSVTTLPDPGIAPQDGFESDAPVLSDLTLVETNPISGSRSLYVTQYPSWTLHLSRGEGTTLRFKGRVAWKDEFNDVGDIDIFTGVVVRVAVVGGTKVHTRYLHGPTVNGFDGALDEVQEFEVPLDEPGADVIVSFDEEGEVGACGSDFCAFAPALVDDLRIE